MTNIADMRRRDECHERNECRPRQAHKRKSIPPTRCESQDVVDDWSAAESSDELTSLEHQKTGAVPEYSDRDELDIQLVHQHDDDNEAAAGADAEEEPLDCVVTRRSDDQEADTQQMRSTTTFVRRSLTSTPLLMMDNQDLPHDSDLSKLNTPRNSVNNDEERGHGTTELEDNNNDSNVHFRRRSELPTADIAKMKSEEQLSLKDDDDADADDDDECSEEGLHPCTVLGCNAVFQSRRSRDRHSSNVQLHHKLLSTVSSACTAVGNAPTVPDQHSAGSSVETWSRHSEMSIKSAAAACFYYMQLRYGALSSVSPLINPDSSPGNAVQPADCTVGLETLINPRCTTFQNVVCSSDSALQCIDCRLDSQGLCGSRATNSETSSPDTSLNTTMVAREDMTAPRPAPDGNAVCHVCGQTFLDNLVLKEHIEKLHPREMYRCTVPGCDKIFSTRKSRNRHSQNDNLHYVVFASAPSASPLYNR